VAKIAVIDIGSNSVRLMVMTNGKTLYKRINTTRLGEGLASTGALSPSAILRTSSAVRDFYLEAVGENCGSVFAFATSAVRSALNGGELVSAVRALCPLEVDVISGEKEAEIGLLGAVGDVDGGILDVGGGSSELIYRVNGQIKYSYSLNMGVVRLFDFCGRDEKKLIEKINSAVSEYGDIKITVPVYGIGGSATSLAAVKNKLKVYSPSAVEGTEITAEEAERLGRELLAMSPERIVEEYPSVPYSRAEVLGGGALLISAILIRTGIEKIIVSERDNLEGYAAIRGLI